MKQNLFILLFALISTLLQAQSQPKAFKDWESTDGTQNFYDRNVVKTDGSGNIYTAGATINGSGDRDILVTKKNAAGVTLWAFQLDGTAHGVDFATALITDASGNVFITGTITNDAVYFMSDLVLIKLNSAGVQQFISYYDGSAHLMDAGADIVLDASGNI